MIKVLRAVGFALLWFFLVLPARLRRLLYDVSRGKF